MEREFVNMLPALQGWRIAEPEADVEADVEADADVQGWLLADRDAALRAAERLSYLRHRLTGRPTGVMMQVGVSDWVVVGTCG